MKKATAIILEKIPTLEKHINAHENMLMRQHVLDGLNNDIERTFIELIWFFEEPKENNFDLKALYDRLDNDWLNFAIDMIGFYFREDTYLIQNSTDSIIVSNDYLDQASTSRHLQAKGLDSFTQNKIATYIYRNKFPKEDLLISGKKFWKISTIDEYALKQLEKKEG